MKVSQEICDSWALNLNRACVELAPDLSFLYGSHKERMVKVLAISNQP